MTTRGTQPNKPDTVELQRKKETSKGVRLDLIVRWAINEVTVQDEISGESHTEWEYEEEKITITYDGDQAQLEQYLQNHQKEILLKAKGKSNRLEAADKDSLSYPTFKADSSYYGQIAEIDVSRSDKKYLKVEKTLGGQTVTAWCYVDYSLLLAHENNDLAVGDYVVVSFVDEDLDKPFAEGKVVGV